MVLVLFQAKTKQKTTFSFLCLAFAKGILCVWFDWVFQIPANIKLSQLWEQNTNQIIVEQVTNN